MVRINCGIPPEFLADQHHTAEYREIRMANGCYKARIDHEFVDTDENLMHPIRFYTDKLLYLQKRYDELKDEADKRNCNFKLDLDMSIFDEDRFNDFVPEPYHVQRIVDRILQKIRDKEEKVGAWYKYCGTPQPVEFFEELMKNIPNL